METLVTLAYEQAHAAHWIFFLLIMLGGLNVPISEDIVLISAGALASIYIPENTFYLFGWLFFACWFSAWEAYWIGRLLGPKLYNIKWFSHILTAKRIERLHFYYEKFGFLTFMVGRFIPGGVRNALFMTSGLGKMPFYKFLLRDLPACLLSASFLYSLGYIFGQNAQSIIHFFKTYHTVALIILFSSLVLYFPIIKIRRRRLKKTSTNRNPYFSKGKS
ncbi:MAG: DedA family protein [Waddliaceae bacterium]